jgi:hypothetical protein
MTLFSTILDKRNNWPILITSKALLRDNTQAFNNVRNLINKPPPSIQMCKMQLGVSQLLAIDKIRNNDRSRRRNRVSHIDGGVISIRRANQFSAAFHAQSAFKQFGRKITQ